MTRSALARDQRRLVEIVEALGFGAIESLLIRGGSLCFDPKPRIVQSIKLDSEPGHQKDSRQADLPLRAEFERLFAQLSQMAEATVDIEIRHGLPFRLVIEHRFKELL